MQENPKSGCLPKEKGDLLSVDHHIVSGQSPGVEEFGTDNAG